MKIYTRKGDTGETGIWGGRRLRKNAARIDAMGAVDETNAGIGLAVAHGVPAPLRQYLTTAQHILFVVGCELMAPDPAGSGSAVPRITSDDVTHTETAIDRRQAARRPQRAEQTAAYREADLRPARGRTRRDWGCVVLDGPGVRRHPPT